MKQQYGFTLIEVLIAMAITAIVAVIAYSGLDSAVMLAEKAEIESDRIQKMNRVFDIISKDFRHVVSRTVRTPDGDAVEGAFILNLSQEPMLKLSRTGWTNPQPSHFQRSQLQRVNYHFFDSKLTRYSWQMMDSYPDSTRQEVVLLDHVKSFQVRVLSEEATLDENGNVAAKATGEWIDTWPIPNPMSEANTLNSLPVAVEINIEIDGWGKIRRVYELVAGT